MPGLSPLHHFYRFFYFVGGLFLGIQACYLVGDSPQNRFFNECAKHTSLCETDRRIVANAIRGPELIHRRFLFALPISPLFPSIVGILASNSSS
jgi:hypothetical protein